MIMISNEKIQKASSAVICTLNWTTSKRTFIPEIAKCIGIK